MLDKTEVSFVHEPSKKLNLNIHTIKNLNKKVEIPQAKRNYKRKNIICEQVSDFNFEEEILSCKLKKIKSGIDAPSQVTRARSIVTNVKNVVKKDSKKKSRKIKLYDF